MEQQRSISDYGPNTSDGLQLTFLTLRLVGSHTPGPATMTKSDSSLPDAQISVANLIAEAQAARVQEHVRAVLSQLRSRASKPLRKAA
jgi:hypothetical protein